eukprot:GHVL01004718.1.p2 GENE.GHVL01004718.1~~GHVL01004718.1.p2  ORF type:complete len:173 (+),score=40.32 GHVL01004718.1:836-1354(+)
MYIGNVIGVIKAYTTRVGGGPLPTELLDSVGEHLQQKGKEIGTTTGRSRRCGWLDMVVLQYAHALNGFGAINLTKLDVLSGLKEIKIAKEYIHKKTKKKWSGGAYPSSVEDLEYIDIDYMTLKGWSADISQCKTLQDLPVEAREYIRTIEEYLDVPIKWIGVGPGNDQSILC